MSAMPSNYARGRLGALHPAHAMLVAGATPLFIGALLSDLAYASSYQIQWANFASWLIVGAMVLTGLALAWALVGLVLRRGRHGRPLMLTVLLAATFILGFINALVHARDAWAMMPMSLILSIVVAISAAAATWAAFARGSEASV